MHIGALVDQDHRPLEPRQHVRRDLDVGDVGIAHVAVREVPEPLAVADVDGLVEPVLLGEGVDLLGRDLVAELRVRDVGRAADAHHPEGDDRDQEERQQPGGELPPDSPQSGGAQPQ